MKSSSSNKLATVLKTAVAIAAVIAALIVAKTSHAQIYKCTKDGKVEYANSPCDKDAKPAQLKGNVTVLGKEAFTGKKVEAKADEKGAILGIKPIDPIGDCTKKGGKIDKELRACIIP